MAKRIIECVGTNPLGYPNPVTGMDDIWLPGEQRPVDVPEAGRMASFSDVFADRGAYTPGVVGGGGGQTQQFQDIVEAAAFLARVRVGTVTVPDGYEISILNEPCGRSVTLASPLTNSHIRQCSRGNLTWRVGLDTSVVHALTVVPTTQGVDGDTAVVNGATVWRRGVIDGQGTANTWTFVGNIITTESGAIDLAAEYGLKDGDDLTAAWNHAQQRAYSENKYVIVSGSFIKTGQIKVFVPTYGRGPRRGACHILDRQNDGGISVYCVRQDEAPAARHFISGFRFEGDTAFLGARANCVPLSLGRRVKLWRANQAYSVGDWIYTGQRETNSHYVVTVAGNAGTTAPSFGGTGTNGTLTLVQQVPGSSDPLLNGNVPCQYARAKNITIASYTQGPDATGWVTNLDLHIQNCNHGGYIAFANSSELMLRWESIITGAEVISSRATKFRSMMMQGSGMTTPHKFDDLMSIDIDTLYLEPSNPAQVPFISWGSDAEVIDLSASVDSSGFNTGAPCMAFDRADSISLRGPLGATSRAVDTITTTARTGLIDWPSYFNRDTRELDRKPNYFPDFVFMTGFRRVLVQGAALSEETAISRREKSNVRVTPDNTTAIHYVVMTITDPATLADLSGQVVTFALEFWLPDIAAYQQPANGDPTALVTIGINSGSGVFVPPVQPTFRAQYDARPGWNLMAVEGTIAANPAEITCWFVPRTTGAAGAGEFAVIEKGYLMKGRAGGHIRAGRTYDACPNYTTLNGRAIWTIDSPDFGATNEQYVRPGDEIRFATPQPGNVTGRVCTTAGKLSAATFRRYSRATSMPVVDDGTPVLFNSSFAGFAVSTNIIVKAYQLPPLLPGSIVRWEVSTQQTNASAGQTRRVRVYLGTSATVFNTVFSDRAETAGLMNVIRGGFINNGATNAQLQLIPTDPAAINSAAAPVTATVETNAGAWLLVTCNLANAADSITINAVSVTVANA